MEYTDPNHPEYGTKHPALEKCKPYFLPGAWDVVERDLRYMDPGPTSRAEVWSMLHQACLAIPMATLQHLVESMPWRVMAVIRAKPHAIRYGGFCPQQPWIYGKTYGSATHQVMMDNPHVGGRLASPPDNQFSDDDFWGLEGFDGPYDGGNEHRQAFDSQEAQIQESDTSRGFMDFSDDEIVPVGVGVRSFRRTSGSTAVKWRGRENISFPVINPEPYGESILCPSFWTDVHNRKMRGEDGMSVWELENEANFKEWEKRRQYEWAQGGVELPYDHPEIKGYYHEELRKRVNYIPPPNMLNSLGSKEPRPNGIFIHPAQRIPDGTTEPVRLSRGTYSAEKDRTLSPGGATFLRDQLNRMDPRLNL